METIWRTGRRGQAHAAWATGSHLPGRDCGGRRGEPRALRRPCSQSRGLSTVRCRFSLSWTAASAPSSPNARKLCFAEINKLTLKFSRKGKGPRRAKTSVKRKNKGGGLTSPKSKTYPDTIVINNSMDHSIRPDTQVMGAEDSPETNHCVHGQLIFDKGARSPQWQKKWSFQLTALNSWNANPHENDEVQIPPSPHTRGDLKWTKGLNIWAKTTERTGKSIGENLHDLWSGKDCLDVIPRAWSMKLKSW